MRTPSNGLQRDDQRKQNYPDLFEAPGREKIITSVIRVRRLIVRLGSKI